MTHRRLWSVATALQDVHAPLHSATSVSSWLLFRRQSAVHVSMSFEGDQEVFASSYLGSGRARFHCNDLLQGLVCRYAGIQSDFVLNSE